LLILQNQASEEKFPRARLLKSSSFEFQHHDFGA
jgi:hypothetical protein